MNSRRKWLCSYRAIDTTGYLIPASTTRPSSLCQLLVYCLLCTWTQLTGREPRDVQRVELDLASRKLCVWAPGAQSNVCDAHKALNLSSQEVKTGGPGSSWATQQLEASLGYADDRSLPYQIIILLKTITRYSNKFTTWSSFSKHLQRVHDISESHFL